MKPKKMAWRWDARVLGMKQKPKKKGRRMMEQKINGFQLGWENFKK